MTAPVLYPRRICAALGAAVVLASTCTACLPGFGPPTQSANAHPSASAPSTPGVATGDSAAAAALKVLPVKGKAAMTGYGRTQFGQAWTDDAAVPAGHNSCGTRDDVLRRDLTSTVLDPKSHGCTVIRGALHDPYTGKTITFVRGNSTSAAVQVDHLVSLGDAWITGAQQLNAQQRTDLANDPLELEAVDGPTNERKGDGDAATWLPPNHSYRCMYVARQIAVKTKYHLWVTGPEKAALVRTLTTCPTQALPGETDRGVAVPAITRS